MGWLSSSAIKAEGGLRDAAVNALDLVERIGRHIRAVGVIQHVGILPIGVGHGTQVQVGRVQVDGAAFEEGRHDTLQGR